MLSLNFTLVLKISKCLCFTSKQDLSQMLSWNHRDIAHCRVGIHFRDAFQRRLSGCTTANWSCCKVLGTRDPGLLFNPRRGVNGVKAAPPPYLHIKKAIRGTRLCKRRGWPRVPTGDEKNFEIRALINLLSGTATTAVEGGPDEVFVGLSSLSRGLSEVAREFKVSPGQRGPSKLRHVYRVDTKVAIKNILTSGRSHTCPRARINLHRNFRDIFGKIQTFSKIKYFCHLCSCCYTIKIAEKIDSEILQCKLYFHNK